MKNTNRATRSKIPSTVMKAKIVDAEDIVKAEVKQEQDMMDGGDEGCERFQPTFVQIILYFFFSFEGRVVMGDLVM